MPAGHKKSKKIINNVGQIVLRIAMAQINSRVGDFNYNANKIKDQLKRASKMGVDVVIFPELAVTGYPPEDLILKESFIQII